MTVNNYNIKRLSIISDTFGEYSVANGAVINYYEDVLSPTISMSIQFVDTDGVVSNGPVLGGEKIVGEIFFPYSNTSLKIDEDTKVIVQSVTDTTTKSSNQFSTISGISLECIKNETVRLGKKYDGNVQQIVSQLLSSSLGTLKKISSENTSNKYTFIGNQKRPFDTIQWLAPKSIKEQKSGGFLFFETIDGYVFKSVDTLLKQSPVATYTKTEIVNPDDRFIIVTDYLTQNSDLSGMSRMGMYANKTIYWNSKDMNFVGGKTEDNGATVFKASDSIQKSPKLPDNLHDKPTRFMLRMLDVGSLQNGETIDEVQNVEELAKYQNQTYVRLNLLFSQSLNIVVPINSELRAGQVIFAKFPLPTSNSGSKQFGNNNDSDISGNYMISQLRHVIGNNRAYTALKLVRDSFST